ncbi:MAG: outer membrane beta-barrel protein [Flavobacteriales bacterium]
MRTRTMRPIALFVPLLLANVAFPQASGLGIKGGPLLSDTHSGASRSDKLPGATIGLYFPLHAGTRLELQPEFMLTALGAAYEGSDGEISSVRTVYAQVPIAMKLFLSNAVNFHAGVQGGRLLFAEQYTPNGTSDLRDSYSKMDWGVIIGGGVDLRSGVDFMLRYYSGMAPVLLNDESLFPRNRSMQFTIGYRLMQFKSVNHGRRRK